MKYLADLQKFFHRYKAESNAIAMKKYMKNQFEFLGIKSPERRRLLKHFTREKGWPGRNDVENIVVGLYSLKYREFHYTAIDITDRLMKKPVREDIYAIEYLLEYNQWWDTIDIISTKLVSRWMLTNENLRLQYFKKWIDSPDIWLNRAAILFQLKYKENTNLDLLTYAIERFSSSKEFFHQKAIGWALREYAKTNEQWVYHYINQQKLAPLSKREALKHIK